MQYIIRGLKMILPPKPFREEILWIIIYVDRDIYKDTLHSVVCNRKKVKNLKCPTVGRLLK